MKAMILAAGLGTRLRPLTDTRPKALVEIQGRTLLEITIRRLQSFGVSEFIVNTHHFADQIAAFLRQKAGLTSQIVVSNEAVLLDTGGGLKKAAWFFEQPGDAAKSFILHNVDVLSNIDLRKMELFHVEQNALATLAVQKRESSRQLLFNEEMQLCGREIRGKTPEIVTKSADLIPFAFSGIHIISPAIFSKMTETGIFSIIDTYLRLAREGERIAAFRADEYYWKDLGRPEDLAQAAEDAKRLHLL